MADNELVLLERRGAVALITLNREKALNAFNREVLGRLKARVEEVGESDARALVVTGAGRAFAAGADIAEMQGFTSIEAEAFSRLGHASFGSLEALSIPTIAAVNGYALGGGCELALACDWIYASTKAQFGQPEVKLGTVPGFGGTSRLTRRVGIGWAKELVMSGEALRIDDALRIGLVNRAFEPEALLDAAIASAENAAAQGPIAVAAAKRLLQENQDADVRTAHYAEQKTFAASFSTEDRAEGMAAFVEKREPVFKNR